MAESSEGKPADGAPAEPQLPVVWSPRLNAEDGGTADGTTAFAADETVAGEGTEQQGSASGADAPLSRSLRFALLAASIAAAAAIGSFAGSLSASGVAHLWPAGGANASMAAMTGSPQAARTELAELSALKANLDGGARNANGQLTKLAERLDRIERAQIEPSLRLARIADAIDRLEKKSGVMASAATTAPETTGSIAGVQPAAPAGAKFADLVLPDWIVQDVTGGRALIQSRYGGIFEVAAGSIVPGLGRVESIKREDGQWIVVTAHGVIVGR